MSWARFIKYIALQTLAHTKMHQKFSICIELCEHCSATMFLLSTGACTLKQKKKTYEVLIKCICSVDANLDFQIGVN